MNALDLRFQTIRVKTIFTDPDFQVIHKFPLGKLIVFGLDVKEQMWYGWRHGHDKDPHAVYVFQDDERAPPPFRIADSFTEFLQEVAIGNRMIEENIKRLRDRRGDDIPSDYERFDDPESDDEEYTPPLAFIPFYRPTRGFLE